MTDSRTIYTREHQEMIMRALANATGIMEELATILDQTEEAKRLYDCGDQELDIDALNKIRCIIRSYEMDLKLDQMEEEDNVPIVPNEM